MTDVFAELNPPYRTIVADPPWRYGNQSGTPARGHARKFYSTMTLEALEGLPVTELADESAHLWLWGVNKMLDETYRLARLWGFDPVTLVTWCKRQPGVGYYLRNNTEHALLASRGAPMVPDEKPTSTWFVWPRGPHSVKPAAFLDLVEQVSPGPYVELFSRSPRLGWDSWGYGHERQALQ